jgi:2'-5' RNA ligase
MRLFTGIALPDALLGRLAETLDLLRPTAPIQWSPVANLHITTKFLGEFPEAKLEELKTKLSGLEAVGPIDVEIANFGWFPNPHSPRVLWCGIKASDGLARLAASTDAACATLGVEPESRAYSPHLTLARIKKPGISLVQTRRAIASLNSVDFGNFSAGRFHL